MQKKSLKIIENSGKNNLATKEDLDKAVITLRGGMKQMGNNLRDEIKQTAKNLRSEWKHDIDFSIKEAKEEILFQMKDMESRIMEVLSDFMGEMRKSEENRTITAYQVSEVNDKLDQHEQRILKLENKIIDN